eukprot:gene1849-16342_t
MVMRHHILRALAANRLDLFPTINEEAKQNADKIIEVDLYCTWFPSDGTKVERHIVHCAVYGCSNRSNREKDKSFFRIPKVPVNCDDLTRNLSTERRHLWITRINRKDTELSGSHHQVCSDHFISGKPSALYEKDNPDWAPNKNLGHEKFKAPNPEKFLRQELRRKCKIDATLQNQESEANDSQ